jgi:4-hydroxy-tetrahydrodipicolinate reductase
MTRRVLIVGHGRMGRLVESLCAEYGMEVAGTIGRAAAADPERWPEADVAIDFSLAEAVPANLPRLAARGMDVVIGTTGWQAHADALKEEAARHPVGVVAAANFALGVNMFTALAERAAELFGSHPEFGAWIHELHHAAKRDAPSGTALTLQGAMRGAGYDRAIDVSSTRAGSIPGTHTIGFDAAAETITLTHTARDRSIFARGALEAARWVAGRRGWFSMRDVLGLSAGGRHVARGT